MAFISLNTFDHVRLSFNAATSREDRSQIGQFLTPASIADFMSSLFKTGKKEVRILDPGAGEAAYEVAVKFRKLLTVLK